ncbi:hypothetical protein A2160_02380 [Candidatus Beckwithbacteria bacterium RBG_13_42_9]|uniref:Polysaccharide biosynthesis protein C-terminal domain-containing protein n=1 Tax=Candidatus Beckwithbacteria bacterium RBG_13_42_9 TaxID=1797457 RepID=A0A1F5E7H4_9BACT|nr:MAG: hypothetical protein A2160_02380 [Candidatus Beckwithbacteria bacterium RBG_13_42_9]
MKKHLISYMKKLIKIFLPFIFSQTAKDTYLVMVANVVGGLTGLIFTILVARHLSVAGFGTFSSLMNLTLILASLVDFGMTQGTVNFIPAIILEKDESKIRHYIGNMLGVVLLASLLVIALLEFLPGKLAIKLGGTDNKTYLLVAGLSVLSLSLYSYFLGVFQAFKKFKLLSLIEIVFSLFRVLILWPLIFLGLTVDKALGTLIIGGLASFLIVLKFWPAKGIKLNFSLTTLKRIFQFSRWLWFVNMIINIYGKLDVLLLTALTSSLVVAKYAAASRLALVFPLAINSLNAVIAPRFASFSNDQANLSYVKKTLLMTLSLAFLFLIWLVIAQPLVIIVYGERYLESIELFRKLVLANIPLLITIPVTNSLIYFFKKPNLITLVSAIQLIVFGSLSWKLIPSFSGQAPIYGFFVANTLGAILIYGFWLKLHWERTHE